jgi:hypothetical protein
MLFHIKCSVQFSVQENKVKGFGKLNRSCIKNICETQRKAQRKSARTKSRVSSCRNCISWVRAGLSRRFFGRFAPSE